MRPHWREAKAHHRRRTPLASLRGINSGTGARRQTTICLSPPLRRLQIPLGFSTTPPTPTSLQETAARYRCRYSCYPRPVSGKSLHPSTLSPEALAKLWLPVTRGWAREVKVAELRGVGEEEAATLDPSFCFLSSSLANRDVIRTRSTVVRLEPRSSSTISHLAVFTRRAHPRTSSALPTTMQLPIAP